MEKQTRLFQRTVRAVLGVAGGALLLILGVQFFQMRRLLGPLQGLTEFTRHVGEGNFSLKAPVNRADEVGRLAVAFNQMLEKLGLTTVSKDYVDNIIRSMGESLIVVDVNQRIRTINQATLSMLGYSETELLGQPVTLIVDGCGGHSPDSTGPCYGAQGSYRKKDGGMVPVLLSCARMQNDDGLLQGQVWAERDPRLWPTALDRGTQPV
ncbi:MAG: HAMP domain-containing protein [Acidobacteria bacterium]|nr:HAMP domain-containing protein [Acidobacteriota bacterium]